MEKSNMLPTHIGIIMDGNGRWAQKRGMLRSIGHRYGTETIKPAISFCSGKGIKYLTLYAFSTENWKRPSYEVDTLMSLISEYLTKETAEKMCIRDSLIYSNYNRNYQSRLLFCFSIVFLAELHYVYAMLSERRPYRRSRRRLACRNLQFNYARNFFCHDSNPFEYY